MTWSRDMLMNICAAVAVLAVTWSVSAIHAEPSRTPLPPSRPPAMAPTTPSPHYGPTLQAKPSAVPNDAADLDPDHPPMLPPASRAKMHACGREWQDIKKRGADRDTTWRLFATGCLQRPE